MSNPFFDHPIVNSPYAFPARHRELDPDGQPTQQVILERPKVELMTLMRAAQRRSLLQAKEPRRRAVPHSLGGPMAQASFSGNAEGSILRGVRNLQRNRSVAIARGLGQ
jgi:hypothetical protein